MGAWLFSLALSLSTGPTFSEPEAWFYRNLPKVGKEYVWKLLCEARLADPYTEIPDWEHFDWAMEFVRFRAIGKPLPSDNYAHLYRRPSP